MTIIAAEAAPGAVAEAEGAVAERGSAAARRGAVSARATARQRGRDRPRPAGRPSGTRARSAVVVDSPARPEGVQRDHSERREAADHARSTRNHGKKSLAFTAPKGEYHKVVAAEFLFAVAVIAFAPLVTPGSGSASTGPSPYGRQDIQRLAGVFTLFFILALVSHGRPGKMAVMFGLLVDLGVLFRASQRGVLKGIGSAFAKGGGTSSGSGGGGGGTPAGGAVA